MDYKDDIAIVMRTFWPVSPVVGAGMLRVAEWLSSKYKCRVITQNQADLYGVLKSERRGRNIRFSAFYAFSTSSSSFLIRVFDLLWFGLAALISLVIHRPKLVYVATDPPLFVPFVVYVYASLFKAKYIYHIQDIHPEASAIVFPKFKGLPFKLLRWLDALIVSRASTVITLTKEMEESLKERGINVPKKIYFINNPSAKIEPLEDGSSNKFDYCFLGNLGRLQHMPLLIEVIQRYLHNGGIATFSFAGGGVYSEKIASMSKMFPNNVFYFGKVSVSQATSITLSSNWALLPIEDDVCRYAFPSKTSSYALSGTSILCVCGAHTNVAKWVSKNGLGRVVSPDVESLLSFFTNADAGSISPRPQKDEIKKYLAINYSENNFVTNIQNIFSDQISV